MTEMGRSEHRSLSVWWKKLTKHEGKERIQWIPVAWIPTTVFPVIVRSVGLPSWIHSLNKGHQETQGERRPEKGGWTKSSAEGNLGRGKEMRVWRQMVLAASESRQSQPYLAFQKKILKQSICSSMMLCKVVLTSQVNITLVQRQNAIQWASK